MLDVIVIDNEQSILDAIKNLVLLLIKTKMYVFMMLIIF